MYGSWWHECPQRRLLMTLLGLLLSLNEANIEIRLKREWPAHSGQRCDASDPTQVAPDPSYHLLHLPAVSHLSGDNLFALKHPATCHPFMAQASGR